jgi:hypothetical protein
VSVVGSVGHRAALVPGRFRLAAVAIAGAAALVGFGCGRIFGIESTVANGQGGDGSAGIDSAGMAPGGALPSGGGETPDTSGTAGGADGDVGRGGSAATVTETPAWLCDPDRVGWIM